MTAIFSTNEAVSLEKKLEQDENHVLQNVQDEAWDKNQLDRCVAWIKSNAYLKVCLQFPDGLLPASTGIAKQLEEATGSEIFILGDTSYGACCVDEIAAEHAQADAIIHFGHACLAKVTRSPVLYVLPKYKIAVQEVVKAFKEKITDTDAKISLFYDVGYYHAIDEIHTALDKYKNLTVGRLALEGIEPDILCWSIENVKSIESTVCVYIGSDNQSFFNLSMSIKSAWQICDPQSDEKGLKEISPLDTRWLRRRMFCVEKCKDAQSIGIVVGTLTTKGYLDIVERIKTLAKQREIRSYLLSVGKVNPAKLANFMEIDCFVLVGCPENTIYTSRDFYKPLVSVFEIEMALNPAWHSQFPETYCTDFRELLPEGRLFKDSSVNENSESARDNDMSLVTGRVRVLNSQKMDFESTTLTMAEKSNNELVISSADTFTDRSWQGLNPELGKHEPALVQQGRKGIAMKYDNDPSMET